MPGAVVFAYHGFGTVGLEALLDLGVEVRLVLSHSDPPGERCWWPSVAEHCAARGIPCLLDPELGDPAMQARIRGCSADLLASFYFRSLIPVACFAGAALGAWNLHGSLLPRYRGRCPVNWQLIRGERESGLSLHRMVEKADAGEILAQVAVPVHPDQDAFGLTRQLLAVAPAFLREAFASLLAGRARPWLQDETRASRFGARRPEDGRIDWSRSARQVHDLVRAVAPPWPGAFTGLEGRCLQVRRSAVVADEGTSGPPGRVLDDGSVACGRGRLVLLDCGADPGYRPVVLTPGLRLV